MQSSFFHSTIVFLHPFRLAGMAQCQPAGRYALAVERETLEGIMHIGSHVVGAFLSVPAVGVPSLETRQLPVSLAELDDALHADRAGILQDAPWPRPPA